MLINLRAALLAIASILTLSCVEGLAPTNYKPSFETRSRASQRSRRPCLLGEKRDMFNSHLGQSVSDDIISGDEKNLSYGQFAKQYPFANNIAIATMKTALADLIAQVFIAQTPLSEIDYERSLLFCGFGAIYLGGFQYLYQVNIFKKLFDIDAFTSQPWKDKLKDEEGLKALAAQTILDLTVLTLIYLPTFYVFKAGVFSGSLDPSVWTSSGIETYQKNFAKDEFDLIRVWLPADIVCFSVPLYLRLPVRHIVSFVWTAYLSFARGGH